MGCPQPSRGLSNPDPITYAGGHWRGVACREWLPDDSSADVGVVLGYALRRDGTPSAPLRLRVDNAVALYIEVPSGITLLVAYVAAYVCGCVRVSASLCATLFNRDPWSLPTFDSSGENDCFPSE